MDPIELSYESMGKGDAIVLVHGYPLDRSIWDAVAVDLSKDARVILPDLRGFGRSPITEGIYTMRLLADDLAELLSKLGLRRVVLVGHSMGGYVCLAFARAYPERVAGLALVASQAAADLPEKRQDRYKLAEEVKRKGARVVIETGLARYSPDPRVLERTRELMERASPVAIAGALKGMAERSESYDVLDNLPAPVCLIAGEQDALIPVDRAEEAVRMLQRGWLVRIPGGGHMPMWEHPETVAAALRELMRAAKSE